MARTKKKASPIFLQPFFKLSQKLLKPAVQFVSQNKNKVIIFVGLLIFAILLVFPFRFLIIPAVVNNQPIFSWNYIIALHQKSGQQVLNQMINEKLVEQEIAKWGIQVTEADINEQISQIEAQLGAESGGLDTMLSLQGMTRNEFVEQLRLNMALEKLIKNNIEVSDEEITEELSTNPELYQDLSEVDAATTAAENIRNSQLQEAFQTWFEDVRTKANIKTFFRQTPLLAPGV